MRIIILSILLFIISISNGQVSQRCPICPPSQGDAPNGSCLQVNNGVAEWASCGGGGGFWSLSGNSGTDPDVNFIGTTDFAILKFKSQGYFAGKLGDDNANVSFGTQAVDSGSGNTAIGYTALGFISNTSNYNTSVGDLAGGGLIPNTITSLTHCTFIGHYANPTKSGLIDATAIGGGALVGCDSCLVLGDTTAINGVGIGTAYPTAKLDVRGKIKIVDGTQGAGKVLTSDSSGNATWSNQILTGSATLDFGTIAPNGHETLTITVTGAALGDVVSLGIPNSSTNDHGAFMAWVSATDTVSVKCYNFDGVGFDPASGTFTAKIFK